MRRLGHTA